MRVFTVLYLYTYMCHQAEGTGEDPKKRGEEWRKRSGIDSDGGVGARPYSQQERGQNKRKKRKKKKRKKEDRMEELC